MNCPGCGCPGMLREHYEGNYAAKVELDVCHHCNGIWFDGRESLQLTPGATLRLFKSMHERQAGARTEVKQALGCPRCLGALTRTSDRVRSTAFTYFRCAQHGRFISFFQWLREKGLVRAPRPEELTALRAQVKVVNCSNCGAPISLEQHTTCGHCQAPISILSGENIEATLKSLHAKEVRRTTLDPEVLARAMLLKHEHETQRRIDRLEREARAVNVPQRDFERDLISVGIGLLVGALLDA